MTTQEAHKHWLENGHFDGTESEVFDPARAAGAKALFGGHWKKEGDWRLKPASRLLVMAITWSGE